MRNKDAMRQILMVILIFITTHSCRVKKNQIKKIDSKISFSEPRRVLDSIIVVAKNQSLYRKNVNWETLEKKILSRFNDTDSITSIIEPVQYLLTQLGDYHGTLFLNGQHFKGSVFRTRDVPYDYQGEDYISRMSLMYQKTLNQEEISGALIKNNIAYIEIPMMMPNGGNDKEVLKNTLKIRDKICELNTKNPIGWIIDLRGNLGGNMYPMLMGLAELLPQTIEMGGDSYDGKSINEKWELDEGIFYYGKNYYPNIPKPNCQLKKINKNIAVLIGRYTASSGEVVACALKGQNNIKLFGEQTSGATTANIWTPIG